MPRFFLFFLLLVTTPALADSPQQQFLRQFESSRIQFPNEDSPFRAKNPGRYSPVLSFLFQNILGWVPSGEGRILSEGCSAGLWGKRLKDPRIASSGQLQGALIQKYFKECGAELETGQNGSFVNLVQMMSTKLKAQDHPFFHQVVFSLPGNIKLKGLLALKGDFKKRPLVLMRLGVFSNVQEFQPERPWLMMLFEQAPFNVLLLENMSGSDFIANNSQFAFGGYDEGIQNILISQILKDPNEPLSRLVDSLHLFGISLGGHGVFFSSLLNPLNSPKENLLYQSFMAVCPVVNLKETMSEISKSAFTGSLVDLWSRKRLASLPEKLPSVKDHESFGFLNKTVSEVARTYHGGLSYISAVKLPEGMTDGPQFWELNNFWKHYKGVREPVLVFSTHDDPAVPFDLNSARLQSKTMGITGSNIGVVDFNHGIHCTLPIPYDWKALSTLTQSYILSHSPGFKLKEVALDLEIGPAMKGLKLQYKVQPPEKKEKFVKLEMELTDENGDEREMSLNLPLSEFDFRFLNQELSPSEQWMIERWVNQNLSLRIIEKDRKAYIKAAWPVAL